MAEARATCSVATSGTGRVSATCSTCPIAAAARAQCSCVRERPDRATAAFQRR
jgi:hypothetical protein